MRSLLNGARLRVSNVFFLKGCALVNPRIAGRADLKIGRSIRVDKMEGIPHTDGAKIACRWLDTREFATHAIEFRHSSWFVDETAELLRRFGVAFCSFDMVGLECPLLATAPFAYVRFHGSEALYAGNYTDEMLEGWAARLRDLARETDEVYVYFNNDAEGYAVANARTLAGLLGAGVSGA